MINIGEERELSRDDVQVCWVNMGEGLQGDYNEEDPTDENLLRFDVYVKEDNDRIPVDDASYCTNVRADTPDRYLDAILNVLLNEFYDALHNQHYVSVKKLGEQMSWIDYMADREH